jgi:RNA polymerase sigma-70 factor (ECF subfamily)
MKNDTGAFERHRSTLLSLAYRMLGDMARAEDIVQDAWIRWQGRESDVHEPRGFLVTMVTRLCLDDLGSARQRHEESRGDRLPEPVDLDETGIGRVELLDQISMAFLVVLQRLTPAERAVLLLHDIFDMSHAEIGALLGKNEAACRQILKRARENVAAERRVFTTSREEHERLLSAFVRALTSGNQSEMLDVLADDAVLIVDPGPEASSYGRLRKLGRPVVGKRRIVALLNAFMAQEPSARLQYGERTLNGELAIVAFLDGRALAALLVAVAEGRIRHVFFQADPARLRHLGPSN